jgi:hypothetical protein
LLFNRCLIASPRAPHLAFALCLPLFWIWTFLANGLDWHEPIHLAAAVSPSLSDAFKAYDRAKLQGGEGSPTPAFSSQPDRIGI